MSDPAPRPDDAARAARRTVARVVALTLVTISLVTGLTVAVLYRHFDSNLNVVDITPQLGHDRPAAPPVTAQKGPVNILVMGSDNRDAPGDRIDNLTGIGQRSDTTILLHLSGDRQRAYGVSVPRDSIVNRPSCLGQDGQPISAPATAVMWNDAFNIGGPGCTARQFEQLTGIRIDHYVVVDFASFEGMVDAIGGVEVCIPQPIVDPKHGINIPAGTRKLTGRIALNYVRARYTIGDRSDLGREKRQQAFVASMFRQVLSANTLADPLAVTGFLNSATKSLTLDQDLGSLRKLGALGFEFRHIGLDRIQFLTTPVVDYPPNIAHVEWTTAASTPRIAALGLGGRRPCAGREPLPAPPPRRRRLRPLHLSGSGRAAGPVPRRARRRS
jgi:LCP family protein required for cell wall assembly